jgi:hypothetical protein
MSAERKDLDRAGKLAKASFWLKSKVETGDIRGVGGLDACESLFI